MASTGLSGPHPLTESGINNNVTAGKIGAYALGHTKDGTFYVDYVGRSDSDVNSRLHNWKVSYEQFKFGYYDTKKAAFEKECRLYHDFKPTDNKVHPDKPTGTSYKCPVCGA